MLTTGALVPLPKAQATGMRDTITPQAFSVAGYPYRYVLDAQIGNTFVDSAEILNTPWPEMNRSVMQVMWGFHQGFFGGNIPTPTVIGREYRLWQVYPDSYGVGIQPVYDFLISESSVSTAGAFVEAAPIGQLCKARFYYGATTAGLTAAAGDPTFRPAWMYPVSVGMSATPWVRWGKGNYWTQLTIEPPQAVYIGIAVDIVNGPSGTSPSIGSLGFGTTCLGMSLNANANLADAVPDKG